MKAIVLAGGLGTRLLPLTERLPKPMMPLANRPMLAYVLSLLGRHGFDQVFTNPCHPAEAICRYFEDGARFGLSLTYAPEQEPIGTAGSVRRMAGDPGEETLLVIGGDDLSDIDLGELLARHRRAGAAATLALTKVEDTSHVGVAVTDERGRILSFQEKPSPEEAISDLANTGIYLLERRVLDYIPEGRFCDFARDVFPRLLEDGVPFFGFEMPGYWRDIGTLRDYLAANVDIAMKRGPALGEEWRGDELEETRPGAEWAPTATVAETAIIGPECRIEAGARVGPGCVIGGGCVISAGCRLERSLLWPGVKLAAGACLREAIVTPEHTLTLPV